ncbi:MAG: ubiquinol-cytochrome c reductase iron-sulfur subunit [Pseudomonadota bacterium]
MTATNEIENEEPTRREFIHILAAGVAGGGAVAAAWPLVSQMNPDASVLALSTKEVDLSAVEVGQAIKVIWQGKPVFLRRRTPEEIAEAEATPMAELKDPLARNDNLPANDSAIDANRRINAEWMILIGVCTHLGCIPLGTAEGENRGEYNGWFCPCHGSHYDIAGRIRKGPAPDNLPIPPYEFLSDTVVKIG